jgi:predicted ester cyclase
VSEDNKALVKRFYAEVDRLQGGPAELCGPGFTFEAAGQPPMDFEGANDFIRGFYAGIPDLVHVVDDMTAEGDVVATRLTVRGTQTEPLMGMPASGKPFEIWAMTQLTVKDGKVVGLRVLFDQFGMLQQLGAIPAPAAA